MGDLKEFSNSQDGLIYTCEQNKNFKKKFDFFFALFVCSLLSLNYNDRDNTKHEVPSYECSTCCCYTIYTVRVHVFK